MLKRKKTEQDDMSPTAINHLEGEEVQQDVVEEVKDDNSKKPKKDK